MIDTVPDRDTLWQASAPLTEHPALAFNVRVNAVVVGGGIAGATCAYLLKQLGQSVALVDADRCGRGQSARATGHAIASPTLRLSSLVETIGADRTRAIWAAGSAALARIRGIVRDERINCRFGWVPAFLHADAKGDHDAACRVLRHEADLAESLGVDASFEAQVAGVGPAVRFDGQARLNPLQYVRVLVDQIPGGGSYVFEDTRVDAIHGDGPFVVNSGEYRITADCVIVTTHAPVYAETPAHDGPRLPALRVSRTGVASASAAASILDNGLYWQLDEQLQGCLRVDRYDGQALVVSSGRLPQSHELTDSRVLNQALANRLGAWLPAATLTHRWSGYVVEAPDGLPCIAERAPGRFLITAFGDNGLTFGTLGAMIAVDAVLRRPNPWRELCDVARFRPGASIGSREGRVTTAGATFSDDTAGAVSHLDAALPFDCVC